MTLFPSLVMPGGQNGIKNDLKELIKRWKKEAEILQPHSDAKDIMIAYEKCAEDLEKTLLWY